MIDKAEDKKLLAGGIARGLIWVCAYLSAQLGVKSLDESTAQGVALFLATLLIAAGSLWWSKRKNAKLEARDPRADNDCQ